MQETTEMLVGSLGQEDLLENGMQPTPVFFFFQMFKLVLFFFIIIFLIVVDFVIH